MANDKTKKSQYQSRYGGGYITAAQFITELICEHNAKATKRELTQFFWNDEIWAKDFKAQLVHANRLLKTYDPAVIITVLQSNILRYKRLTSLGAKWLLDPLFKAEQKKEKMLAEKIEVIELPDFEAARPILRKPPKMKKSNLEDL